MIKVVNGVEKVLAITDFCEKKLSERLGLMEFNDFTLANNKKVKDLNGVEVEYSVFAVKVTNHFNNKQVTVNVDYTTSNKVALEDMKRKVESDPFNKVFIDFKDVVVGHYNSQMGNISILTQTYKAVEVGVLERKEAEKILKAMEDMPIAVEEQAHNQNAQQQKQ